MTMLFVRPGMPPWSSHATCPAPGGTTIWLFRSTPTLTTGDVVPRAGIWTVPSVAQGPALADGIQLIRPPGLFSPGHSSEMGCTGRDAGRGVSTVTTAIGVGRATTRVACTAMLLGAPMINARVETMTMA